MKNFTILFSLLFLSLSWGQEQTPEFYPLRFRFDDKMSSAHLQINETSTRTSYLRKDLKTIYKKGTQTKIKLKFVSQRVVQREQGSNIAAVTVLFFNGAIDYRGAMRFYCEVDNPRYAKKKERYLKDQPAFPRLLDQVSGGIRFKVDIDKLKVSESARLLQLKSGKHDYQQKRLSGDPFHIEDSLKELPWMNVPVGYTWEGSRRNGLVLYKYKYKFVGLKKYGGKAKIKQNGKIIRYRGKKLALIEISGNVEKAREKVGTIEGRYYHDIERDIMVERDVLHRYKCITPLKKHRDKHIAAIQREESMRTRALLLATNAKKKGD